MTSTDGSPVGSARTASECSLWRLVEGYHALVYYAPERAEVYSDLGLRGGWMGYFASRSAGLGTVPPDVVTACFFGFAPRMVERALPDAWRRTTPADAAAARLTVFDRAVRRHLGDLLDGPVVEQVADHLCRVVDGLSPAGAPLFAAHRGLPRPDAPHLRLFWATGALREFRGDAHVAALRSAGLDPVTSNLVMVALGLVPHDQRTFRGWTEAEWAGGADRLAARGWLGEDGALTGAGQQGRTLVEDRTDAMTACAWHHLDDGAVRSLAGTLGRVVEPIVTAGGVPYPNGMGMAPAPELAASP